MTSKWLWFLAIVLCIMMLLLGALVNGSHVDSNASGKHDPLTGRAYRIIGTHQYTHKDITVNDSDALTTLYYLVTADTSHAMP